MPELFDVMTYDTEKVIDTLDIGEVYQQIGLLTTPTREEGLYEVDISISYTLDSTTKSAFLRWRLNASIWYEFVSEPSDKSDVHSRYYSFPTRLSEQSHLLEVEARKEDAVTGQFDIGYLDLTIKRVGA